MVGYRLRLEMLNLSQNRLDDIQGLKTLGGLIALNLGTQVRPFGGIPCPLLVPLVSMDGRQSEGASDELCFGSMGWL